MSVPSARGDRAVSANGLLIGFCLAAWWLASPYLGLGHDAQYYAADAMRRSGDFDALNSDLFFARGTQGDYSIFPLAYTELARAIGIQAAALSSTALARILWLIALAALCAAALPGRRALAGCCALLVLPCSYGVMHILAYAEPFATPRHWAELAMLLALMLILRGRPLLSGSAALLATAIHPLIGLPGLLMVVVAMPLRWRRSLLLAGATATLAGVGAGIGPLARAFDVYDPAWFAIVEQYNLMVLPSSWDLDFLGKSLAWLLLWGEAVLRLPPATALRRLAAAGWGVTVLLLLLWLLGAGLHSVLLIQLQFYRVLWLMQILTPICLIAALPAGPWRPAERGALALSAAALLCDYAPAVLIALLAIGLRGWHQPLPWARSRAAAGRESGRGDTLWVGSAPGGPGLRAMLAVSYAVLALLVLARLARIDFAARMAELFHASNNPLLTTMSGEPALVGLCGAVLWLGIARPVRVADGRWTLAQPALALAPAPLLAIRLAFALAIAMPVAALSFWLYQATTRSGQDRAWEAAIRAALPPGDTVYWDQGLRPTWILLGRASYAHSQQAAGALFARAPAIELMRRLDRLDAAHLDTGRKLGPAATPAAGMAAVQPDDTRNIAAVIPPDAAASKAASALDIAAETMRSAPDIAALCADPALDLVLLNGERADAPRHFRWLGKQPIAIYSCHVLRVPTVSRAVGGGRESASLDPARARPGYR